MSDILCIYYSRTGNTRKAMGEIAAALDAERYLAARGAAEAVPETAAVPA